MNIVKDIQIRQNAHLHADHFDVLIVGAGISGIDAAYHMQQECPGKRFVLLETQETFGGTWTTHKYPGIRSDSDLFTFGYGWKPWDGPLIATADEILSYLDEALDEQDIRKHIRYRHKVTDASWSNEDKQWVLTVTDIDSGDVLTFTGNFLWMCQGYYRHSEGYTPNFPGMKRFKGHIVHPQTWPEDLDYKDKEVLVIGSGATAATLIPAMADATKHITMLQRSPTYFFALPNRSIARDMLRKINVSREWTHDIVRNDILINQKTVTRRSFEDSEALKNELIAGARLHLGPDFDVNKHFTPSYRPWRQRLAVLPDGDLFQSIRKGKASVVTDHIETFTEDGILLQSGAKLKADIIVTATGFNMSAMGDVVFKVEGRTVDFSKSWGHRTVQFSDIPNMAWVFGYLRASWTLRADLVSGYVCRLLNYMEKHGYSMVTPRLREQDKQMEPLPFITEQNFNAGYIMRKIHLMPRQGDKEPWVHRQDYFIEKNTIPAADLEDGTLIYE